MMIFSLMRKARATPPRTLQRQWLRAGLTLSHPLRRWASIEPAPGECLALADPCAVQSLAHLGTSPRHHTFILRWFNVVPASQTLAQIWTNGEWICRRRCPGSSPHLVAQARPTLDRRLTRWPSADPALILGVLAWRIRLWGGGDMRYRAGHM